MSERQAIGYLEAIVRIPLYAGDETPGTWWEFAQPAITDDGQIGVCRRPVTEVSREIKIAK